MTVLDIPEPKKHFLDGKLNTNEIMEAVYPPLLKKFPPQFILDTPDGLFKIKALGLPDCEPIKLAGLFLGFCQFIVASYFVRVRFSPKLPRDDRIYLDGAGHAQFRLDMVITGIRQVDGEISLKVKSKVYLGKLHCSAWALNSKKA